MSRRNYMCSTTPSGWVILHDIYCIDIVSTTTGFYLFDTLVILHHICRIDIVRHKQYLICSTKHHDRLHWIIFIILISWVLQRYMILSPIPWWRSLKYSISQKEKLLKKKTIQMETQMSLRPPICRAHCSRRPGVVAAWLWLPCNVDGGCIVVAWGKKRQYDKS